MFGLKDCAAKPAHYTVSPAKGKLIVPHSEEDTLLWDCANALAGWKRDTSLLGDSMLRFFAQRLVYRSFALFSCFLHRRVLSVD